MRGGRKIIEALALALAAASAPSFAQSGRAVGGDPCAAGIGNAQACKGNPGNLEMVPVRTLEGAYVEMPAVTGRSAYIAQIGDSNDAAIVQSAANAVARIEQRSNGNDASIVQQGAGAASASIMQQIGDSNIAAAHQDGAGRNVLILAQDGASNRATVNQFAGAGEGHNGAALIQSGDAHVLNLDQTGNGNHAILEQRGFGNMLDITQDGDRHLTMIQDGKRLGFTLRQEHPSLMITQTGPNGSSH